MIGFPYPASSPVYFLWLVLCANFLALSFLGCHRFDSHRVCPWTKQFGSSLSVLSAPCSSSVPVYWREDFTLGFFGVLVIVSFFDPRLLTPSRFRERAWSLQNEVINRWVVKPCHRSSVQHYWHSVWNCFRFKWFYLFYMFINSWVGQTEVTHEA